MKVTKLFGLTGCDSTKVYKCRIFRSLCVAVLEQYLMLMRSAVLLLRTLMAKAMTPVEECDTFYTQVLIEPYICA